MKLELKMALRRVLDKDLKTVEGDPCCKSTPSSRTMVWNPRKKKIFEPDGVFRSSEGIDLGSDTN
jgi:hypothetical protein